MKYTATRKFDKARKECSYSVQLLDREEKEACLKYSTSSPADCLSFLFEQFGESFEIVVNDCINNEK